MNFKFCIGKILALMIMMTMFYGCLSVAKISDFSRTSATIDFEKYSNEYKERSVPFWTSETSNEYYIERDNLMSVNELSTIIQAALKEKGNMIISVDTVNKVVLGKRGMYANEWNSITGVYFKIDVEKKKTQIYINTRITQDITGGWRENRAKKVGLIIENAIDLKK